MNVISCAAVVVLGFNRAKHVSIANVCLSNNPLQSFLLSELTHDSIKGVMFACNKTYVALLRQYSYPMCMPCLISDKAHMSNLK